MGWIVAINTTYVDFVTPITADWLNNVNTTVNYTAPYTGAIARSLNSKTATFVDVRDFGAKADGVSDDYPAFAAAIAAYGLIYVPAGTYLLSQPLDLTNKVLFGAGRNGTSVLLSTNTTITNPVLYAGGATCISQIQLGFKTGIVTGSETGGQRPGIIAYGLASQLALQRGATLSNLLITNVGTGLYSPPGTTGISGVFSCIFDNIEIQGFTYNGWDFEGGIRTGNVYRDIYINNVGTWLTHPVNCGFLLTGEESECTIEQLNVEWMSSASTGIFLQGVRALTATAIHFEEVTLTNTFTALLGWTKSSGYIGALTAYYIPIKTSGWFLIQAFDSTYDGGVANPTTCNELHIGTLHTKGLNDGPQVSSGNGLNGLSNFFFVDRELSAVGPFYMKIDRWVWNTFQSDSSVYQNFPNDPHTMIQWVSTIAGPPVGRVIPSGSFSAGWVRRADGIIEQFGPFTVAANTASTINFPIAFVNQALYGEASSSDTSTSANYSIRFIPVSATQFQIVNASGNSVSGRWFAFGQ